MMAMKIILPQFFLFSKPIEEMNVAHETTRKPKKNSLMFENMKLANAGIFSSTSGLLRCWFISSTGNIRVIMMFCKMEINVAKPAKTMKIHARTVTNVDFGWVASNSFISFSLSQTFQPR